MSDSESFSGKLGFAGASFKWEIEKEYLLDKKVGEFLTSPIFHAFYAKWQIKLFPRGTDKECKNHTSIILQLLHCVKRFKVHIVGKFMYKNGTIYRKMNVSNSHLIHSDTKLNSSIIVKKLCEYDSLISHYLDDEAAKCTLLFEFNPEDCAKIPEPLIFAQALNNQQYSDIKFTVEGKNIHAHKIVLANKSKVFAAMFNHKMKENLNGEVKIDDVGYDVLLELFRYIYTGIVNDIEKMAKPLMMAADKYELIDLKADCIKHLEENFTVDNVKDYLDLAERHNVDSLKNKVVKFIKSNANEMAHMPDIFKSIMEAHPDVVIEVFQVLSAKKPRLE